MGCGGMPELISDAVRRMRKERQWSSGDLAARTVLVDSSGRVIETGLVAQTIEALERSPGRVPRARTIECLARAFEMEPGDFYEWPLAVAQRDAGSTPEAGRRRAADAARKAAQRRSAR